MSPSEAQAPGPRPLVVGFVNRLSGGQLGAAVFAAVQNLGLDAVHDLSGGGPRPALVELLHRADPTRQVVVLCFGGDGTFNWLASTLLALREEEVSVEHPAVNVSAFHLVPCPLGTGNDLARSLGWGHRFPGMDGLPRFVAAAQHARLGPCLDVWRVHFNATAPKLRRMQNYFSIGVDAEVARRFDVARTSRPESFRSAVRNKVTYAALGSSLLVKGARSLDHRVKSLTIDGAAIAIPTGCKSIVLLNIPSFGAGTHPWGDGPATSEAEEATGGCLPQAHTRRQFQPAAVDDGLLEVVALFGIMDAASMHLPLSRWRGYGAKRLGQGSVIDLQFRTDAEFQADHPAKKAPGDRHTLAAQVDGEAWAFPCWGEVIRVSPFGRVGAPCGPRHVERGGWPWARHKFKDAGTADTAGGGGGGGARAGEVPQTPRADASQCEGQLRDPVIN